MRNLNKDIKLFFLDLDGTLLDTKLNGKDWISDENVAAIAKIKKEGKHVVISTGRYGKAVQQYMKRAGVEYAVTGNGARVVDDKGKIYKDDKLTLKQSLLILDFVKKHKLIIKLDGDTESYGAKSFLGRTLSKKFGFFPNPHYNLPMHNQYSKIVIWGKSLLRIPRIRKELQNSIEGLSVVTSTKGWTVEVTNEKATKGLGNIFVAEKFFGITEKKHMAHLGDTLNDSTTVSYMRLIAMGNSTRKLKNYSQYIGPDYKNGGVARIIDKGEYKKVA